MEELENMRSLHQKQLEREVEGILRGEDLLRPVTMFDPELGIGSSEALKVELEYAYNIAARYKRPYSIAIFNIDGYEEYDAHYGRRAAKLAHKLTAEHIRHSCRSVDRIYRYDAGTTILLILPETNYEGGCVLAERVVAGFSRRNIPNFRSAQHGLLTLSGSVASYEPEKPGKYARWGDMIDDALLHLHLAQGQGGNMIGKPLPA
ncbi:MAG TPA: GGDEF domain-containing protein [Gammaproteobacteria bacterium]|nr:GGDEF domain-containing protein [Gammaproteobacteria bacterium]